MPNVLRFLLLSAFVLCSGAPAYATILTIAANTSDPAPRAAWTALVDGFRRENPDIKVEFGVYDHESYKTAVRNWLTGASPDVIFWFAGERMREFARRGLLEDVGSVLTPEVRAVLSPSAVELSSYEGRPYGVPYSHYQIGIYYRRDLVGAHGLEPPRDWPSLLAFCARLRHAGIDAFAIGTKDLWPAAAWFDYLDLRLNGGAFHRALTAGDIAFTDPRVRAVFARWRELLDAECFVRNHTSMSWQASQALIHQGRAAAMLIGNFAVQNMAPELRARIDFAPFPVLDPSLPRFEEAPLNTLHIPARATNKTDARRFLAHVLRADVQARLAQALLVIPTNREAAIPEDRFVRAGAELLAGATGLTQYLDRDMAEDVALAAMKGFQEFMVKPDRLETILADIERARRRSIGR